jgi:polyhydroxybutyrate depolymerase
MLFLLLSSGFAGIVKEYERQNTHTTVLYYHKQDIRVDDMPEGVFDNGDDSIRVMWFDGRLRSYWVHIPPGYNETSTPLVIVLHAGGSYSLFMQENTGFSKKADDENFIVIYPNGVFRLIPWWRMWNGGYCCGIAYENNIDDVGFIQALIDGISEEFVIDRQRIYITGHSNGAILAYRVAAELSHLIAAVGPVAGTIGGKASADSPLYVIPDPDDAVSVIHFHGLLDQNVPYNGGTENNSWDQPIDLSVNESIEFWVTHNGCAVTPQVEISSSGNIIRASYTGGYGNTEVVLYTIVNGGHGWPGSGTGDKPSKEISATDVLWEFFKSHPK